MDERQPRTIWLIRIEKLLIPPTKTPKIIVRMAKSTRSVVENESCSPVLIFVGRPNNARIVGMNGGDRLEPANANRWG